MAKNKMDMPMIDVDWACPAEPVHIFREKERFHLLTKVNGEDVNLYIAFPMEGGIRLYTDKTGFFAPHDVQPILYETDGGDVLLSAATGTTVRFSSDCQPWKITIADKTGKSVLALSANQLLFGYVNGVCRKVKLLGNLREGEGIYGLGERFNTVNHVGTDMVLWNVDNWSQGTTAYKNMPILHSTNGYMLFFNATYSCVVDVGCTDAGQYSMEFEGPKWDMYLWTDTPLQNIQRYTDLTGKPVMPPRWAFRYWAGGGFQVWENKGKENHLQVVQECMDGYARLGMPDIAAVFGEGQPFHDKKAYDILNKTGTRMLAWNHPSLMIEDMQQILGTTDLKEIPYSMDPKDHTKQAERECIDFTHPNAIEVIKGFFKEFWEWGLKGCMVDYGEILPVESLFYNGMSGDEMHNFFSYWYNKAYHDAWDERMHGDYVLFSRSSCAGCQKWVCNFGGDQTSTFQGMRQALNGMLNFTACGFSFWGSDIGGYGGPPKPDVYIRWLQFGTFSPFMRAHGGGLDRNPWTYGRIAEYVFQQLYWIRENLLEDVYSHAVIAHKTGIPMTQMMSVAFPDEQLSPDINAQYMFCDDLLVCPVVIENDWTKEVTFPKGVWYDFWTGKPEQGNQTKWVDAPLDRIPVYIQSGAVIPVRLAPSLHMGDSMQDVQTVRALLLTPTEELRVVRIWLDETRYEEYKIEKTEDCRFSIQAETPVEVSTILVYGRDICAVTVDEQELPKRTEAPDAKEQFGFFAVGNDQTAICLPSKVWNRITFLYDPNSIKF